MTIEYKTYQKMIMKRAWIWHHKMPWMELDDLIAEGNLCFCKSLETFDPDLSQFGTYLYNSLQMHFGNLRNIAMTQKAEKPATGDLSFCLAPGADPEQVTIFHQIIDRLTDDAKEICRTVFETPVDMLEMLREMQSVKVSRNGLQKYFVKKKGWRQGRIWEAFKEIQQALLI